MVTFGMLVDAVRYHTHQARELRREARGWHVSETQRAVLREQSQEHEVRAALAHAYALRVAAREATTLAGWQVAP